MANIPPTLGKKVSSRELNWLALCQNAWGSEFNAPDHGIYEWSNGVKFDSTDKWMTGLYNPNAYEGVMLDNPHYPDMPSFLLTEGIKQIDQG